MNEDDAPPLDIRPPGSRFTFALDMFERLIVVVLTLFFLARLSPMSATAPTIC